jgi:hypothetical protein|tara:strand:+ start:1341 stop:2258 length:918 start_codon:yes stop_codon:yes gene_type:complete
MPKITSITTTDVAANSDLLVITANTSGQAVTRTVNVATIAAAVQVSTPIVSQINTTTGNVVANTTTFTVSIAGANGLVSSASGNTITLSANLDAFQNQISEISTPDGSVASNTSQGFQVNYTQANGILMTASGNTINVTFDPSTINTLTDVQSPAYNTEGNLPTASSNYNGHTVVAAHSLYHGARDEWHRNLNLEDSADEMISHVKFSVSANGSGAFNFAGGGAIGSDNEGLYLYKGLTYQFDNADYASHPFQIRISSGGGAYTNGISNNASGNIVYWTVPQNAANVVYQCTNHSAMLGTLTIVS